MVLDQHRTFSTLLSAIFPRRLSFESARAFVSLLTTRVTDMNDFTKVNNKH